MGSSSGVSEPSIEPSRSSEELKPPPRLDMISSSGSEDVTMRTMTDLPAHLADQSGLSDSIAALEGTKLPPILHAQQSRSKSQAGSLRPDSKKMEPTVVLPSHDTKRVIVCGAGIIGLTTCYFLAKQGHEVLCVEKEASVGTQVSLQDEAFLDPAMYQSWADRELIKRQRKSGKAPSKPSKASKQRPTASNIQEANHTVESPMDVALTPLPLDAPMKSNGVAPWPKVGKPVRVEMSALRDTRFWKWGVQFFFNSKKGKADEHSRTIRELGFYSMLKLRELQATVKKSELDMNQTAQGTLELFPSGSMFNETLNSDRCRHLSELGMDLQPLNAREASNLEPSIRQGMCEPGALFSAFGTNGDMHKMCKALYRLCMREGVMFRFNTEVQHILSDATGVIALQTSRGSLIEGDEFVLALGNSSSKLARSAGINLSTYPVKGYVLSVPVKEQYKPPLHNIYAGGLALISPLGRTLRVSGGADFANPNKGKNHQKRFDWLLNQAKSIFPDDYLDVANMTTRVCYRPVTADDVPSVGRTQVRNLYVNVGHGSKGWTLSFGCAAMLADEITGIRPKLDMTKFDPHRFGFFG